MAGTQILSEVIADQRAWTAQTIDTGESWRYALTPECFAELDAFLAHRHRQSQQITGTRVESADFPACAAVLEGALGALERGRGFAIVERLSFERYTRDEAQMVYWVIGQLLGVPFAQDVKGTLLYDVRDTGQDPTKGARFSVSNVESSFHMDHCFGDPIPDILGLLSLQGAKSGGRSQFLSAYTLHNELLTRYPQEVATLYEPFYFDRRGQFKEGEKPVFEAPIFRWDAQGLHIRYLYYYIQVGQERMEGIVQPSPGTGAGGGGRHAAPPGPARRAAARAGPDALHQQPLAAAQPHLFRGLSGTGKAAAFGAPLAELPER